MCPHPETGTDDRGKYPEFYALSPNTSTSIRFLFTDHVKAESAIYDTYSQIGAQLAFASDKPDGFHLLAMSPNNDNTTDITDYGVWNTIEYIGYDSVRTSDLWVLSTRSTDRKRLLDQRAVLRVVPPDKSDALFQIHYDVSKDPLLSD